MQNIMADEKYSDIANRIIAEGHDPFLNKAQEEIAVKAGSLFFQEEMLEKSEMIDLEIIINQLYFLRKDGVDMISWKELYPILKRCVI
jgi:hypothetical protein